MATQGKTQSLSKKSNLGRVHRPQKVCHQRSSPWSRTYCDSSIHQTNIHESSSHLNRSQKTKSKAGIMHHDHIGWLALSVLHKRLPLHDQSLLLSQRKRLDYYRCQKSELYLYVVTCKFVLLRANTSSIYDI